MSNPRQQGRDAHWHILKLLQHPQAQEVTARDRLQLAWVVVFKIAEV